MALLVCKVTDKRLSAEQLMATKVMSTFLEKLQPENAFLVITHCDLEKPDDALLKKKLESINKHLSSEIPESNIILFDKTPDSLEDFV